MSTLLDPFVGINFEDRVTPRGAHAGVRALKIVANHALGRGNWHGKTEPCKRQGSDVRRFQEHRVDVGVRAAGARDFASALQAAVPKKQREANAVVEDVSRACISIYEFNPDHVFRFCTVGQPPRKVDSESETVIFEALTSKDTPTGPTGGMPSAS